MSGHEYSGFSNVFAALQQLASRPGGAENDLALDLANVLGADSRGRSDAGAPLPGADRPTSADFYQLECENARLIDHAEMMACALGACPNCWGNIPDCDECGGMGKPGAYNPDPECFTRFVLPVVYRMMGEGFEIEQHLRRRRDLRNPNHPQSTSV